MITAPDILPERRFEEMVQLIVGVYHHTGEVIKTKPRLGGASNY
jgi:hypothetical protein